MYFFIYFIKHLLRKYKYEKTYTKEKKPGVQGWPNNSNYIEKDRK